MAVVAKCNPPLQSIDLDIWVELHGFIMLGTYGVWNHKLENLGYIFKVVLTELIIGLALVAKVFRFT